MACPTEGVWGLSCRADDERALRDLIALKGRSAAKGFILLGIDRASLQPWLAPLEPAWRSRMDAAWPGPVTFIVPAARHVSPLLTGGRLTLAVRVSAHAPLRAVLDATGVPLVSTSANPSGAAPLTSARAIHDAFGHAIAGILDAAPGTRRTPSDIVDVRSGKRLR